MSRGQTRSGMWHPWSLRRPRRMFDDLSFVFFYGRCDDGSEQEGGIDIPLVFSRSASEYGSFSLLYNDDQARRLRQIATHTTQNQPSPGPQIRDRRYHTFTIGPTLPALANCCNVDVDQNEIPMSIAHLTEMLPFGNLRPMFTTDGAVSNRCKGAAERSSGTGDDRDVLPSPRPRLDDRQKVNATTSMAHRGIRIRFGRR